MAARSDAAGLGADTQFCLASRGRRARRRIPALALSGAAAVCLLLGFVLFGIMLAAAALVVVLLDAVARLAEPEGPPALPRGDRDGWAEGYEQARLAHNRAQAATAAAGTACAPLLVAACAHTTVAGLLAAVGAAVGCLAGAWAAWRTRDRADADQAWRKATGRA